MEGDMMVLRVISIKIDEELLYKIDRIAKREKRPRSDIIRFALEMYVDKYFNEVDKMRLPYIERIKII